MSFVSPILSRFVSFEERNLFVAIFGLIMLSIEPFALLLKIKNARIRAILRSELHKKETGKQITPKTGGFILYGFMARLLLRSAVAMISFKAFGLGVLSEILVVFFLVIDISALVYVYAKTDFFEEKPNTKYKQRNVQSGDKEWIEKNLPGYHTLKSYWKEVAANLVLQLYAIMLFTAFIDYSSEFLVDRVTELGTGRYPVPPNEAALGLFPMYLLLFLLCIMPIRIAYWIEDSLQSFNKRESLGTWLSFTLVLIFCFVPLIIQYNISFGDVSNTTKAFISSPWMNLTSTVIFLSCMMVVRWTTRVAPTKSRQP